MNIILVIRGFLKNRCKDTKFFGIDNSQFTIISFFEILFVLKYIKRYVGVALLPLRHIKLLVVYLALQSLSQDDFHSRFLHLHTHVFIEVQGRFVSLPHIQRDVIAADGLRIVTHVFV